MICFEKNNMQKQNIFVRLSLYILHQNFIIPFSPRAIIILMGLWYPASRAANFLALFKRFSFWITQLGAVTSLGGGGGFAGGYRPRLVHCGLDVSSVAVVIYQRLRQHPACPPVPHQWFSLSPGTSPENCFPSPTVKRKKRNKFQPTQNYYEISCGAIKWIANHHQ